MRLDSLIDDAVRAVPERVALFIEGRALTYREVGDAVSRAAGNLSARGVRPGDRIALADACGVLAVAAVLGASRIGAATAPMDPALTAREMRSLVEAAGCGRIGVAGASAQERLASALDAKPFGEDDVLGGSPPRAGTDVAPEDVAAVLFTSGTTGTPKPVPLTHATLQMRIRGFAPAPDATVEPGVALMCVPFHHVAGIIGTMVGLAGGSTNVVQRRFDAGEWLDLVAAHRVNRSFLVPAMLRRILDHTAFAAADLSSLAMITYGAAPAAADLVERAVAALPHVAFVNVFGQTETLGAVTALGPDDHRAGRAGSVGRPLPGVEVRIVDPETGADVAPGTVGEFWVRAAHTVHPGWVRTGDLVREDTEGFLYATGRLSDLINRAGEKISPAEVEAALRTHPLVREAAVTGVPDAEMGERVAAAVVAAAAMDADELRTWCRERLAGFKVPERFAFVDTIPHTELGKVSRSALAALFERDA